MRRAASMHTSRIVRVLAVLMLVASLAACGFQLRGPQPLPFDSIYVNSTSELGAALKRSILAQGSTRVADNPKDAAAVLQVIGESTEKRILSLNSAGRVREYQLVYRFAFKVSDPKGRDLLAPTQIELTRDITFNDAQVLAKEAEEALLYRDMRADLINQIMRRLAATRPGTDAG